jgi:hypothetical protein
VRVPRPALIQHCAFAQGACKGAVPDALAAAAATPPLADLKPGQCVLLTDDRLFQFQKKGTPTWMDLLVIRLVWQPLKNRDFINLMGVDTATVWLTNMTFQGDLTKPARARGIDPWEAGSIYIAGALFA